MKTQHQNLFGNYLPNFVNITVNSLVDSVSAVKPSPSQTKRKAKTHDYRRYERGTNYVFESTDGGMNGYMTAQGNKIKPGEYLLLQDEDKKSSCLYQVEEIDYYANPSDMWIAKLKKVPLET